MTYDVQPIADDIAERILAWCGVTSPTPAEVRLAQEAALCATDTIREIRGLDDARSWMPNTVYALNDVRRPSRPNEHLYKCTTAGTSDDEDEPTWPTTTGGTVSDNTVTWTEYTRPFEQRYYSLAVEMGVYLYRKRGVDGAVAFGENGVQQSFEKGSFPPSMLSRISPPAMTG